MKVSCFYKIILTLLHETIRLFCDRKRLSITELCENFQFFQCISKSLNPPQSAYTNIYCWCFCLVSIHHHEINIKTNSHDKAETFYIIARSWAFNLLQNNAILWFKNLEDDKNLNLWRTYRDTELSLFSIRQQYASTINVQSHDTHIFHLFCTWRVGESLAELPIFSFTRETTASRWTRNGGVGKPVVGCGQRSNVTGSSGSWLGSSCLSWRLQQSFAPVSHLGSAGVVESSQVAQLDETIPTEGESSCGTEDVQSPHSTIFGSKDWSSGTCWPVFLQNSYNTLLFFSNKLVTASVLRCVFGEKGGGTTLKLSRLTGQDLGRSSPVLLHWFRVDDSSYLEPWQPSRSMHNAVCFAS